MGYIETKAFEGMQYAVRFPDGYEEGKTYPVLLFLHGAGTRGSDIQNITRHSFMKRPDKMPGFPFVVVAPLCHKNTWFDLFETLERFALFIASESYTDKARIYLTGNSMGGYGSWQLAMSLPELFAAVMPICGGGMYWNAARLVNVPVWAFHGGKDGTVFLEESERMVNAVNKKGGNAKLTVYPEHGHDSWTDTYNNPEIYTWLLSHENDNAKQLIDEYNSSQVFG